jgi:hypothetical protein
MELNDINVNITLTAEQAAEVTAAMSAVDDALTWLISVSPTARKRMLKLGPKSEAFVQEAVNVARDYAELLPSGLSAADLERDIAIRQVLLPVQQKLEVLLQKVKDTSMVAGSDLMQASSLVYRSLQSHGHTAGLGTVTASLGRRFVRQGGTTEPEAPTEPQPTPEP